MLSHLRFHRRGTSNPSSPSSDQPPPSWPAETTASAASAPILPDLVLSQPSFPADPSRTAYEPASAFDQATYASSLMFNPMPPLVLQPGSTTEHRPSPPPQPSPSTPPSIPSTFHSSSSAVRSLPHGADAGPAGGLTLRDYLRGRHIASRQEAVGPSAVQSPNADGFIWKAKPQHLPAVDSQPPSHMNSNRPPLKPAHHQQQNQHQQNQKRQHQQHQQLHSITRPPVPMPSFVAPTDRPVAAAATPPGSLSTLPSHLSIATGVQEPPKGRMGFLKNPVSSLLMRRKAGQNAASDLKTASLDMQSNLPLKDPRIYGTRFLDFGAPRPKATMPSAEMTRPIAPPTAPPVASPAASITTSTATTILYRRPDYPPESVTCWRPVLGSVLEGATSSTSTHLDGRGMIRIDDGPSFSSATTHTDNLTSAEQTQSSAILVSAPTGIEAAADSSVPGPYDCLVPPSADGSRAEPSTRSSSSVSGRSRGRAQSADALEPARSMRSTSSRHESVGSGLAVVTDRDGLPVRSSIRRRVKSTSSRFSFDMLGAANQERLLEERHRELERQTATAASTAEPPSWRDSRFDDFDENFDNNDDDYDGYADELEEVIPGVNADLDEAEEDFEEEFEEEEALPGVNAALDDDEGEEDAVPGFNVHANFDRLSATSVTNVVMDPSAATVHPSSSTDFVARRSTGPEPETDNTHDDSGLGLLPLFDFDGATTTARGWESRGMGGRQGRNDGHDDDLYFDDGMVDLFEADNTPADHSGSATGSGFGLAAGGLAVDETIFDRDDDTDPYGRPVAGAFARAQSQSQLSVMAGSSKRESDTLSQQSAASPPSTAHTSLSLSVAQALSLIEDTRSRRASDGAAAATAATASLAHFSSRPSSYSVHTDTAALAEPSIVSQQQQQQQQDRSDASQAVDYQAALAAATCHAAASGKFRRASSTAFIADEQQAECELGMDGQGRGGEVHWCDPDADGRYHDDWGEDENDWDDDDIIAEANASALANDPDGWYSREFNFYAMHHHGQHGHPAPRHPHPHPHPPQLPPRRHASAGHSAAPAVQYANGGFFALAGLLLGRSASSGRAAASREPNLTPITERSEYSNRNSVLSAAAASPPAAANDDLSLSALLRLRTRAWGGSSDTSSREGSPRADTAPAHARKNSGLSVASSSRDSPPAPSSPVAHAHSASAESISYSRDDAMADARWVMERRRTGESGRVEILGREIVDGI